ncbi:photosystem II protein PsbQ [Nostoc linckia z18]|jgi:photosystem II protein PsbQ|uniref:Photosystem II protein PsbQ n=3 Tax=Nostoc TaxID=1177 RepID=A0A9Q5ZAY6_NOSLI|nr:MULTISPECIES: photosystem II protein PsbQ [Nostoc]MBL1203041.1 photosystem II protein PsbQ [Nostoc sp. GBBB01]MDZ8016201.1 photosystem II protein PsbQ [Nostoc sp. ZfuVER08]PHK31332.1 photosystem II protein PsbQ [Nostoc linckia z15]PHK47847.1 photosystem II protein PsbQ [Nostoc linckia z16]MBD2616345.1 photosystem II protein PsbQ [Nostoc punctiforme FACHB-252]
MKRQSSIFSLILVLLATFLISCGGPGVAVAPPTYTASQIAEIKEYVPEIQAVRDRSQELKTLIQKQDWINVSNFIHGPITEARLNLTYVTPHLLPKDQTPARQITRDLFNHLVKINQGASSGNAQLALTNSEAAFADIDKFLQLLPEASTQ